MYKIRDWLYIGKYQETRTLSLLQQHGISAMLQLAEKVNQPGIETCYLAIEDGVPLPVPMLERGVAFIREQKAQGKTILVACGAGISRSVTFGIAALMEQESRDLFDAYREIYKVHPQAEPHFELVHSLTAYYGKPMDVFDILDALRNAQQSL
jgi:protein-tyrosine phosphatase